jgi:hypothetical protein
MGAQMAVPKEHYWAVIEASKTERQWDNLKEQWDGQWDGQSSGWWWGCC